MKTPAFSRRFKGGETITDELDFSEFLAFHPRADGLSNAAYAHQLQVNGLAIHLTSEEVRDIAAFKEAMAQGRAENIPVVITTGSRAEAPAATDGEIESTKADALAQARGATR